MRVTEVVVCTGLGPSSCLAVDNRDVVVGPTSNSLTSWSAFGMGLSNAPLWGFPMESLKKLSAKPPTSIGVVTCGISSCQVGEVSPFGTSRQGASTEVPSTCLALVSLIIFKQWTRTMFKRVESSVINIRTHCWGVWDLTHIPEVQWPAFVMKSKLTHALRFYLWVPSWWGKEPHCFQMKVTLYLWLPNSGPTQGCQNVTGSWAICISPWAMGFGWTPLFNQKGTVLSPVLLLVQCLWSQCTYNN